MHIIAILSVLVLAPLTDAITQEPLTPGHRIRVTAPSIGLNKHVGRFQELRGDTLVFAADSILDCPLSDITRLEAHRGQRSNGLAGALTGLFAGALVGVGAGSVIGQASGCDEVGCIWYVAGGGGIGGVVGALGGLAIGESAWKTDIWERVPLDRLRVSIVPTRNGFGLGARIAF